MIEYVVSCDLCSTIIDGGNVSAAHTRRRAIVEGSMVRVGKQDVCAACDRELQEEQRLQLEEDLREWNNERIVGL